jgi:hypothetical protein
VVVGGPTHAFGMSRENTREDATRRGGTTEPLGIRDYIQDLAPGRDVRFAVFDTRVAKMRHLPGSAARGASRALHRKDTPWPRIPRASKSSTSRGRCWRARRSEPVAGASS